MSADKRADGARRRVDGHALGLPAGTTATARALAKAVAAEVLVLVEGVSDQIAVETLADRCGRDLTAEGVAVLPIGGAHAMRRHLTQFGPAGADLRLAGLYDVGEEDVVRRALGSVGVGSPRTRRDMERLGFYACVDDLEDEFIRSLGAAHVEALIDAQGELRSFRSLQAQPAWRGQPTEAQLRRFLGSGATRKLRYARLLAGSVDLDRLPAAFRGVLRRCVTAR